MGETRVHRAEKESAQLFVKRLLNDVHALETMIDRGLFETGVRRIGAEQELFLVDPGGRPARSAMEVLAAVDDDHFTTELGLFNLEINLDPLPFGGDCLARLELDLERALGLLRERAESCGAEPVLAGILPSLRKSDMGLESMTPLPRYFALNEATGRLRDGPYKFWIKGVDELSLLHDSVMLEACNASFQVHLQVEPAEFARLYNAAQVFAAPCLAAAANSPLLFGRRLWQETRIALFQQAVDTREADRELRDSPARVHFGRAWLRGSVVDLFKDDIARHRILLCGVTDEDPFAALRDDRLPELEALRLHNGTIWRWNRPCYGITGTKPHLRIENRILPSGPTVKDEVANAAFWLGLMSWAAHHETDFADEMEFEDVKANFLAAARQGLAAQFSWVQGRTVPAQELIERIFLPMAREGLEDAGVDRGDVEAYLALIGKRVSSGRTGSAWMLQSLARMKTHGTASERLSALTRATITRQLAGRPVHEWDQAALEESGGWSRHYTRVEQFMTTELFTVQEDDLVELVAHMMDWKRVRHVMVEDRGHHLVGMVSYRSLLRAMARGPDEPGSAVPVSTIMRRSPVIVRPDTPTVEAIELMREKAIGCLPVVSREGRLVGVVTERDFMVLTRELLIEKLRE